jgi:enoyl-CoA hydratase
MTDVVTDVTQSSLEELIQFETHGRVAVIRINRPHKANTITVPMGYRVRELIKHINENDDLRAAVVTGTGDHAFCAGTDVSGLEDYGTLWQMRNRESDYALDFLTLRKPVIAAIRGWCVGGGLEIALNCDVRVASSSAKFSAGEIKMGWHGGSGVTQLLPKAVGMGEAMWIVLSGQPIDAERALRVGLIQELVVEDQVFPRAMECAGIIAANAPIGVQAAKHAVRMSYGSSLSAGLAYENDLFTFCMSTEDAAEGRRAFLEKRSAEFRGR